MENQTFLREVGARIRQQRKYKKQSQQHLAENTGIEKANLSRLEGGKTNPTITTLRKICLALETTIYDLTKDL